MSILDAIIAAKKKEVIRLPRITLKRATGPSFMSSVMSVKPAFIVEVKPKSPSQGPLLNPDDIPALVSAYNRHAQAISVLCDHEYFGGGFDLLKKVRGMTDKPLLAKEFIIDAVQIDHAAANGANAILLIAAVLTVSEMEKLLGHARTLHLDVLLEVHSEDDAQKVAQILSAGDSDVLLGINNRDLATLETDLAVTERLVPLIRKKLPAIPLISESGIHDRADVLRLAPLVQGFLIGTSILQSGDPASHLVSLLP